ncbi:hypothetical protein [Nocardia wallacei]|uniref:hypothetical protein n=1 Tax=Nocardia wallacei TaxID=480035 RepID=UPI002459028B|nr:hypothetical protein [Nocardia wallacei]
MVNHPHCLDDREIATVLAALRQFQGTPHHSAEHFADTSPLKSEEIDALCERIKSTDTTRSRTECDDADRSRRPPFAAAVASAGVQLERFTTAIYWCADCTCLFVPDIDADTIYPDRAVPVGMLGDPATDHDCHCHALPYEWTPADSR